MNFIMVLAYVGVYYFFRIESRAHFQVQMELIPWLVWKSNVQNSFILLLSNSGLSLYGKLGD